jgi:hypothetical protein
MNGHALSKIPISKVIHEYTTLFLVLKEHFVSQLTNAGIKAFSILSSFFSKSLIS